jgi:hypothetical protein
MRSKVIEAFTVIYGLSASDIFKPHNFELGSWFFHVAIVTKKRPRKTNKQNVSDYKAICKLSSQLKSERSFKVSRNNRTQKIVCILSDI